MKAARHFFKRFYGCLVLSTSFCVTLLVAG